MLCQEHFSTPFPPASVSGVPAKVRKLDGDVWVEIIQQTLGGSGYGGCPRSPLSVSPFVPPLLPISPPTGCCLVKRISALAVSSYLLRLGE